MLACVTHPREIRHARVQDRRHHLRAAHRSTPDEVAVGPAEVIVLVGAGQAAPAEEEEAPSKNDALFSILEALRTSGHGRRSKEEIDTELAEERGSWEDRA
jgi:hypothetical protein